MSLLAHRLFSKLSNVEITNAVLSSVKLTAGQFESEKERLGQVSVNLSTTILQKFDESGAVEGLGFSVIFFKRLTDF